MPSWAPEGSAAGWAVHKVRSTLPSDSRPGSVSQEYRSKLIFQTQIPLWDVSGDEDLAVWVGRARERQVSDQPRKASSRLTP